MNLQFLLPILVKYLENHPDQVEQLIEAAIASILAALKPANPPA